MERKKTVITILLAAVLTASVGLGTFGGVAAWLRSEDPASDTGWDNATEEEDLIGKVVSIEDHYLSMELYASENPEPAASYETLNPDTWTTSGEKRIVILRSNAKYYRISGGERNAVTVAALSPGDFIAVTLDENGAQNILLLCADSQ